MTKPTIQPKPWHQLLFVEEDILTMVEELFRPILLPKEYNKLLVILERTLADGIKKGYLIQELIAAGKLSVEEYNAYVHDKITEDKQKVLFAIREFTHGKSITDLLVDWPSFEQGYKLGVGANKKKK